LIQLRQKIYNKLNVAILAIKYLRNWPLFFSDWAVGSLRPLNRFKQRQILYILRNGIKYKARRGTYDRCIISEVWFHRDYSPSGFNIGPSDTVVDIGAQVGIFSLFASSQARFGRVFAIEPIIENFLLLRQNIDINNAANVIALNKAVAPEDGEREIYLENGDTAGHSFFVGDNRTQGRPVQTISLEGLIRQFHLDHIDLLKMDCEGAEYEIIFGCPYEILMRVNRISMECHPMSDEWNIINLGKYLEGRGYEIDINEEIGMLHARRLT
jgi:FkbM family methyltransferase